MLLEFLIGTLQKKNVDAISEYSTYNYEYIMFDVHLSHLHLVAHSVFNSLTRTEL